MLEEKRDPSGILYIYDRVLKKASQDRRFIKVLVAPNLEVMEDDCFYACPELEKVVIPKLRKIGKDCFDECPKLTSFVSPILKVQGVQFLGGLFIDLKEKTILNSGNFSVRFVKTIEAEIQKNADLVIEEKEGTRILKSGNYEILKEEQGVITGICLPTCKKLPAHALYENATVKELILLSAEKIDHNAIYKSKALEKVVAPALTEIRFSNFSKCPNLKNVETPNLTVISYACFNENEKLENISFSKLESVDRNCFCHLPRVEKACFPKVQAVGESSFQYNQNLKTVYLPEIIELERGIFYRSGVEQMYAPKIHNRSTFIKYLKNARTLIKNKAVLPQEMKIRTKE